MVKTGWKKEMDALYKKTVKNWNKTGNVKKRTAVSGSISLESKKD